jgi:hypothetical protein
MKKIVVYSLIVVGLHFLSSPVYSQKFIADYTVAKEEVLRSIPQTYIDTAREELIIGYQHTSHGTHVSKGMYGLPDYKAGDDILYAVSKDTWEAGKLYILDNELEHYPPGAEDLSEDGMPFVETTRNFLDDTDNADVNVVMWAWCDIRNHDVELDYLAGMEFLMDEYGEGGSKIGTGDGQREVPVYFIFMTGHANADANVGEGNAKSQAQLIIDYCNTNDLLCLDYYSIDTHDMDDNYWEDAGDNGNSDSYGGNFYQDFQDAHELGDGYYENLESLGGDVSFGDHTTQHITSNRKAYAMWWILARIAGWDGGADIGIFSPTIESFDIYPNPGNGIFTIETADLEIEDIKVLDTMGKVVKQYKSSEFNSAQISLDLTGVHAGFYIVRMSNSKQAVYSSTLIVN